MDSSFSVSIDCEKCKRVTLHFLKKTGKYQGYKGLKSIKRFEFEETCIACGDKQFSFKFKDEADKLRRKGKLEIKKLTAELEKRRSLS